MTGAHYHTHAQGPEPRASQALQSHYYSRGNRDRDMQQHAHDHMANVSVIAELQELLEM